MRYLLVFVFLRGVLLNSAVLAENIIIDQKNSNKTEVLQSAASSLILQNNISNIQTLIVNTTAGVFTQLFIDGYSASQVTGTPELPVIRKLIEVPAAASVKVIIIKSHYRDYLLTDLNLSEIIPAQPPQVKDDRTEQAFVYDSSAYRQNIFEPVQLVSVDIIGFLRGLRIGRVNICPVQYNPVAKTIRVYDELTIKVEFLHADEAQTRSNTLKNQGPYFKDLSKILINLLPSQRPLDSLVQYPVKYVIVSSPVFQTALQPLIEWKKKKGFTVIEAYTNNPEVGSTSTSIKNYLQNLYNTGTPSDPAPSFILLVGDVAQLPSFAGTLGSHPTDLYYAEYTGDFLPDVYYGRFSVTNTSQLNAIINKTLQYEEYTMPDPSFLDHCVMIAGMDATYGPTHANAQINYGTSTYFNLAHGLTSHTYLYPSSGSQDAQIIQDVSNGCCYANYTAHGNSSGWADPTFVTGNVPSLSNLNKYPLMVGNACLTNKFDDTECFGEALIRASGKGALGYIGASNNTYWNEDFWWAVGAKPVIVNPTYSANALGAYDRTFHDQGESYNQWFMTQGQMVFAGNLAVEQGNPSSSDYYWEIYHLLGDPSLMVYFSQPDIPQVTYNSPIPLGINTFTVTTEPYAYVALSQSGILHGAAQADVNGIAHLTITPFITAGTVEIVVTGQNLQPYISTIPAALPNTPLCLYAGNSINDSGGNNNGLADYGEDIQLNLTLHNYGLQGASNVTMTLNSADPYIQITDSLENILSVPAGTSITSNNACSLHINNDVPDGHSILFTLTISCGSQTWTCYFSLPVHAPVLSFTGFSVNDPSGNQNNKLDPGELANLVVSIENTGSSDASSVISVLNCTNEFINIINGTQNTAVITAGLTVQQIFTISAQAGTPSGTQVLFSLIVSSSTGTTDTSWFSVIIGQEPVLIINLDGNNNSASFIQDAINANSVNTVTVTSFPVNLDLYESIFVCLGVYSSNHALSNSEGTALASYLNDGGNIYMEGGDTWYYNTLTPVHPMFKITGLTDGTSDLDTLHGQPGTLTEDIHLRYTGDNSWIDRIIPQSASTAVSIFKNTSPAYTTAVAYDGGSYKTIGASHEFGGLADGTFPSTRNQLMKKYLEFFGLVTDQVTASFSANQTTITQGSTITFSDASSGSPNAWKWSFPGGIPAASNLQNPVVTYNIPGVYPVSLVASNNNTGDTLVINNYITVNAGTGATVYLGNYSGCSDMFELPVVVNNLSNVSAISLKLRYDDPELSYTGYSNMNQALNGGIILINASNGNIYFSYISIVPVSLNCDTLFSLQFTGLQPGIYAFEWDTLLTGNCEITSYEGDIIPAEFLNNQAEILEYGSPVSVIISATPGTLNCSGTEVMLRAFGTNTGLNSEYTWMINNVPIGNGITFSTTQIQNTDQVTCLLSSDAACASGSPALSNILSFALIEAPVIDLGNDTVVPFGQTLYLTPGNTYSSYLWSTGAISPGITITTSGTYTVTVTGPTGCPSSDSIHVTVISTDSVTGNVRYSNSVQTPLGNITLYLRSGNTILYNTESQTDGGYSFTGVSPDNYNIMSYTTRPWGGVNATDALLTMKHFVGMSYLTGLFLKAADVDNSNMVNALDALMIQKRSVGLISYFPAGDWTFTSPVFNFTGLETPWVPVKGLCVGDVNGSHLPASSLGINLQIRVDGISVADNTGNINIPVKIEPKAEIGAISLYLQLPPEIKSVSDVNIPENNENLVWRYHSGILAVSWYSTNGISCQEQDLLLSMSATLPTENISPITGSISLLPESELTDINAVTINNIILTVPGLVSSFRELSVSVTPNPFSRKVTMSLYLSEATQMNLLITDVTGRIIKTVPNSITQKGLTEITWDGTNEEGIVVADGLYFMVINTDRGRISKPLIKSR